jgi:hypothetical protein
MITAAQIKRLALKLETAEEALALSRQALDGASPAERLALDPILADAERADADARGAYLAALAQSHADRVL